MSLLVAPYNNAMRLGQGFNSYMQQICVDDAVVIDPDRAENVITNDGTTMRIMAQTSAKPSAWNRQKEVIVDDRAEDALPKREVAADSDEASKDDVDASPSSASASEDQAVGPEKPVEEEPAAEKPVEEKEEKPAAKKGDKTEDKPAEKKPAEKKEDKKEDKPAEKKHDDAHDVTASSDSDSLQKVDHHEIKEAKEAESAGKDKTKKKLEGVELAATTKEPAATTKKPAATTKEPAVTTKESATTTKKPAKSPTATGTSAQPAGRPSSSSVGGTGKPSVKAQKDSTPKSALAKSKAQEAEDVAKAERIKEETARIAEQAAVRKEIEKEVRDEERVRRVEDREEQRKIREEKRTYEARRREDNRKAIANAADLKALSLQDLEKIKAQNQFADRFVGMVENQEDIVFDPTAPRGPSQTVVYTSKFVDRLSDVTDDMSISGSLSIKAAKIGGSGRGSFVDSDKFKESDLNFYISVKVVNQTLNFKDALVYNPLRSVDATNFQQVYGDSFISGFVEGGEFNALVSMKILNKAKLTDIKAEAKVAFTAGPIDVTAEANVGIAHSNIETNTETTIQVSWSGGGHIKPMEQQWDIKSLMAAASRFPDLVADCPQRTYAILTKYDSLRSFVARKPAAYTPLQYENAQIYTNALMDSFMSYKALYKKLGEHIFNIQGKTLEIISWEKKDAAASSSVGDVAPKTTASSQIASQKDPKSGLYPYVEDLSRFEASLKGLSDARQAIRRQMMRIVNEVDLIEKDPKRATDEDHNEPFQSPVTFETRLPDVAIPEKLRSKNEPLTGKRIGAKPQSEDELKEQLKLEEEAAKTPALYGKDIDLDMNEKSAFDQLKTDHPGLGQHLQVSSAVGSSDRGTPFNNLEFLQADWEVESVRVEIAFGAVACVEVSYDNGLLLRKGKRGNGQIKELNAFQPGERVAYASLEYGVPLGSKDGPRVLAVRLYTNHGRRFLGQATRNEPSASGKIKKDEVEYEQVKNIYIDSPLTKGTFKGFFGRSNEVTGPSGGILRLGLIWGDLQKSSSNPSANASGVTEQAYDYGGQTDGPKKQVTYAQAGNVRPPDWPPNFPNVSIVTTHKFETPYSEIPRMLTGLLTVDQDRGPAPIKVGVSHQKVMSDSFQGLYRAFDGSHSWCPRMSWLALPENDVHFETGVFDASNAGRSADGQVINARIPFVNKFARAPTIFTWLCELNFGSGWHSLSTYAQGVTPDAFDLDFHTWAGRKFEGGRVGWLAFDDTGCVSHVKAGRIRVTGAERSKNGQITFEGAGFSKTPAVFIALAEIDSGDAKNLRLSSDVSGATKTGFSYSCGTWAPADDHQMDHSDWIWIAVE